MSFWTGNIPVLSDTPSQIAYDARYDPGTTPPQHAQNPWKHWLGTAVRLWYGSKTAAGGERTFEPSRSLPELLSDPSRPEKSEVHRSGVIRAARGSFVVDDSYL